MSEYRPRTRIWTGSMLWYPDSGNYHLNLSGNILEERNDYAIGDYWIEYEDYIPMLSTGIKIDRDELWDGDILEYELALSGGIAYVMIGWYEEKACWGLYSLNGKSKRWTLYEMTKSSMWLTTKKIGNRYENADLLEKVNV